MHSLNGTYKQLKALRKALEPYVKLQVTREDGIATLRWGKKIVKRIPARYYDKL